MSYQSFAVIGIKIEFCVSKKANDGQQCNKLGIYLLKHVNKPYCCIAMKIIREREI